MKYYPQLGMRRDELTTECLGQELRIELYSWRLQGKDELAIYVNRPDRLEQISASQEQGTVKLDHLSVDHPYTQLSLQHVLGPLCSRLDELGQGQYIPLLEQIADLGKLSRYKQ